MDRSAALALILGAAYAGAWMAPGPAWAGSWWVGVAAGILVSASLAPALLGVALVGVIGLFLPLPPWALVATAISCAALCRIRTWRRPSTLALVLLPACAASAGWGAAGAAIGSLIIARMLVPGPNRAARGLATLANTIIGQATFLTLCSLLPLVLSLVLPLAVIVPRRRLVPWLLRFGCRATLASPPTTLWRCTSALDPALSGSVIIANHVSVLDILIALTAPGRRRIIAAKPWVFRSPLLAYAARVGGMLPIREIHDPHALRDVGADLDLVFFPEGSRSHDGRTGRFHNGALAAANAMGRRINTLIQCGTGRCLAPGQGWIRPGLHRTELAAGAPPDPVYDKAWLTRTRQAMVERIAVLRFFDLAHPLSRLDRWEACAHRGWRCALAWMRAEWHGHWRACALLPDQPLRISGDHGGSITAAVEQYRPWSAASATAIATPVRIALHPPSDASAETLAVLVVRCRDAAAWAYASRRAAIPILGTDLALLLPSAISGTT